MRLQNLENVAPSTTDLFAQLRSTAQTALKSVSSGVSSAFGKTLSELESASGAAENAGQGAAARQNFVASLTNSRATLTVSSPAASATPAAAAPPASGLQVFVDAADVNTPNVQTGPGAGGPTPTTPSRTTGTGTPSTPTDPPPTGPAAAPTPYSPTQTVSSDPTQFMTSNYSEQLLYSSYLNQANNENNLRYQNYTNEYQNWQLNGSQGQPPAAPVYVTIDQNSFAQWYALANQDYSQGVNAPDVSMFMANGPDYGNGYYGAVGSTQVGTLYNPTGPATAAQIASAGSSNTSSSSTATHT